MGNQRLSGRRLKKKVSELLRSHDPDQGFERLLELPARQVINSLFSFILSADPQIHWPAVTAMGTVVARLAEQDMEPARVIMRRFMWQLNDESGGIGWGCPESMGEATARHQGLAEEFSPVLISYIREDGNFLEYEPLQRGAVWGIGRLAQDHPRLARSAYPHLLPLVEASDAALRALAAWALGWFGMPETRSKIEHLFDDPSETEIFEDGRLQKIRIMDLIRRIDTR